MQSQSHWYLGSRTPASTNPAGQAFDEAIAVFRPKPEELQNFNHIKHLQALIDVQRIIERSRSTYEDRIQGKKARKWLSRLSSRICHYGRILDVLVQHHPEYVSLAWGAFKFLFVLVENHEKHVAHLAKALVQIADVLPRIELANTLYPTDHMQQAVVQLYGHIIRFFIRSERWYQQGKLRHTWEALARPVELHYNDLIEEIERCTRNINEMANAGSRAEQRDIHLELRSLKEDLKSSREETKKSEAMLQEMRGLILSFQSLQENANLDTNQRLTDLQLNQIMSFLSRANSSDPLKILQYRAFMLTRQTSRHHDSSPNTQFWTDPKFQQWEAARLPTMLLVHGCYQRRHHVQAFTVGIVNMLREQKAPVLWALKPVAQYGLSACSATDVLKDLTCQAIRINVAGHTESALALSCKRFRTAETPEEWAELLARAIAPLPRLYIVIDLESVSSAYSQGFRWLSHMSAMLQICSHQQLKGQLKILLVSCGRILHQEKDQYGGSVVNVRQTPKGPVHRMRASNRGKRFDQTSCLRGLGRANG